MLVLRLSSSHDMTYIVTLHHIKTYIITLYYSHILQQYLCYFLVWWQNLCFNYLLQNLHYNFVLQQDLCSNPHHDKMCSQSSPKNQNLIFYLQGPCHDYLLGCLYFRCLLVLSTTPYKVTIPYNNADHHSKL